MSDRETKFLGFAELLYSEISKTADDYAAPDKTEKDYLKAVKHLIAQRAYDFLYTSYNATNFGLDTHTIEDLINETPDMFEFPPLD